MNIHFTAGDLALIYSLISIWVIGFILLFANGNLIASIQISRRFTVTNAGFLLFYTVLGIGLFHGYWGLLQNLPNLSWVIVLVFVIPVMPILHFIYLFCMRRKLRNGKIHLRDNLTHPNPPADQSQQIQPPELAIGTTADERLAPLVKKSKDDSAG